MKRFFALLLLALAACLDPLVDDEIAGENVFGDPTIDPKTAPHVEGNLELADRVAQFPSKIAYLKAFADGDPIWYWNVGGPNANFIAPLFIVIGPDGMPSRAIIDVLPGDLGYSPWWRVHEVRTTAKYNGERIWSRAAIDAGVRLGILEEPVITDVVRDCPVVRMGTVVPLGDMKEAASDWVWYRRQRVDWIDFGEQVRVEIDVREMPSYPVYIIQRINESQPIYELVSGVDINGDGVLNASNNIFASKPGGPKYSPLWHRAFVRAAAELPSIDTGTVAVVTSEDDVVDGAGNPRRPLILSVDERKDSLVNCPIQKIRGEL